MAGQRGSDRQVRVTAECGHEGSAHVYASGQGPVSRRNIYDAQHRPCHDCRKAAGPVKQISERLEIGDRYARLECGHLTTEEDLQATQSRCQWCGWLAVTA